MGRGHRLEGLSLQGKTHDPNAPDGEPVPGSLCQGLGPELLPCTTGWRKPGDQVGRWQRSLLWPHPGPTGDPEAEWAPKN